MIGPRDSYVRNCVIISREPPEVLFREAKSGIVCTLDGYAIIPMEQFNELMARPVPKKSIWWQLRKSLLNKGTK